MIQSKKRTIFYVDGFNLYYGVLKNSSYKWLDLERLFKLLRQDDDIVSIKYFTTIAAGDSRIDQQKYLQALVTLSLVEIIEGRFKPKQITCGVRGCSYSGNKRFIRLEEKQTDVNIAVQMISDAYEDKCDKFIIISGDSDFVPALNTIKLHFPEKELIVYVPARHASRSYATELRAASDKDRTLPLNLLKHSQFSSTLPDGVGGIIEKPSDW